MPITLKDIRDASTTYMASVTTLVKDVVPDTGAGLTINVGDKFRYTVETRNTAATSIKLKNITYHLRSGNSARAKLIVPAADIGVAKDAAGTTLAVNSEHASFYLTPAAASDKILDAGDTDTIVGLKAKALAVGAVTIYADIHADIDLDYLFPKGQNNTSGSANVTILE